MGPSQEKAAEEAWQSSSSVYFVGLGMVTTVTKWPTMVKIFEERCYIEKHRYQLAKRNR
jgi:hypothetical protein